MELVLTHEGDDSGMEPLVAAELILEGLHQHLKLTREDLEQPDQLQGDGQVQAPQAQSPAPRERRQLIPRSRR